MLTGMEPRGGNAGRQKCSTQVVREIPAERKQGRKPRGEPGAGGGSKAGMGKGEQLRKAPPSPARRHGNAEAERGSLPIRTGWRGGSSLRAVAGRVFFLQHHDLTPKMLCNGPRRGGRCWSTATTSHSTPVLLRSWPKSPKNPTKLGGDGAGAEPVGSGSFAPAPALDAVAKSQQSRNAKQLRGLESCPLRAPPD